MSATDPLLLAALGLLKRHIAPAATNGIGDDSLFSDTDRLILAYENRMCGLPTRPPVPEVRYDVHGTAIHYEKPGRFRGLLAHEASALSDALYYDLPGSPCLLTLRKRWVDRAAWEVEDEATRVEDRPLSWGYDYGRVSARNYNED